MVDELVNGALADKNIVFLGDSIAWGKGNLMNGDRGGTITDGFQYCIKQKHPKANVYNFSVDGGVLSSNNYDTIYEMVSGCIGIIESGLDKMEAQGIIPDYIIMDGGGNDMNYMTFANTDYLGTVSKFLNLYHERTDGSTVLGSLEDIFIRIRTSYPKCKIIYFTVPMTSYPFIVQLFSSGYGLTEEGARLYAINACNALMRFYTGAYKICSNFKVQFVNLLKSGLDMFNEENALLYSYDGVHPTRLGYEYMYPIIDDALLNMRNDTYCAEDYIIEIE